MIELRIDVFYSKALFVFVILKLENFRNLKFPDVLKCLSMKQEISFTE